MKTSVTRAWWVLSVLVLAVLVIGLDVTILNVALATLSKDLGASNTSLQWILDSYVLVLAGLLLPFGVLGDRIGRKRLLVFGLIVFGISSALSGWANTTNQLIAYRALMGLGAAVILPVSMSTIPAVFPRELRGKAIAGWAAGMAVGLPLGPILGGYLLEHFWWGSVFLINIPVVALAVVAALVVIPETLDEHAPKIDMPGAVLSAIGLSVLVYGIIEAPNDGWTDPLVLSAMAAGVLMLFVFVGWEHRLSVRSGRQRGADHPSAPLVDLRHFTDRAFTMATLGVTAASFALFGLLMVMTQYLQVVLHNTTLGTGIKLLPMIGGMMVGSPAGERLAARLGHRTALALSLVVLAVPTFGFLWIHDSTSYAPTGWLFVPLGFGLGAAISTSMDAIIETLPPDAAGAGTALSLTIRQVGGALGVAILGSTLAGIYRNHLDDVTRHLPAKVAGKAGDSISAAAAVAKKLPPPQGKALGQAASSAFIDALHSVMLVTGLVTLASAIIIAIWMPGGRVSRQQAKDADRRGASPVSQHR
jgi:EmrB/QacA subfamily drug resistance transporter